METRRFFCVFLSLAILLTAPAANAAVADDVSPACSTRPTPDKVAVLDGHVVHDAGLIWNHVSNWGLIGSAPGLQTTYSDAPSAMWPPYSGNDYLWAAGLWVGAMVDAVPRVTTGGYHSEFLPTAAPGDTIHIATAGTGGGNRYPWPDADDDGDGLEDEEFANGRDDDGDTQVDEDFAAFGDQQFVGTYNDFEPALQVGHPDHAPLGLNVVQRSIQWGGPLAGNFIGFDFTITNLGPDHLEQVYLGLFSDCDIGSRGLPIADNDYAGYVATTASASDGALVPVRIAYMYDGAANNHVDGYIGWVLCGHTTDPAGAVAPIEPDVTGYQCLSGNASFEQGGDPGNDAERYQLLSAHERDPDVPALHYADYRVLMASGPFGSLAPGQSLSYQVAMVMGAGLDEMIANAAEAVAAYRGVTYDRDGNPANGAEFRVHWLPAEGAPVSAGTGRIQAAVVSGGVDLLIETNSTADHSLMVVRRPGAGVPERHWSRDELEPAGTSGHLVCYRLRDTDPVGWPRQYALVTMGTDGMLSLAQTQLDQPPPIALALRAGPNPFNPMVTVHTTLPQAGPALLQVFDLRGHLVRTLLDGVQPGGANTLDWHGDDDAGRSLASGVYQLRLVSGGDLVETRVTLIR